MLHFERDADPCVVHSLSSRSCFCTFSLNASSLACAISSIVGPVWHKVIQASKMYAACKDEFGGIVHPVAE